MKSKAKKVYPGRPSGRLQKSKNNCDSPDGCNCVSKKKA